METELHLGARRQLSLESKGLMSSWCWISGFTWHCLQEYDTFLIFAARLHLARLHSAALAIMWCLGVWLGVCRFRVLCQNVLSYSQTSFTVW